MESVSIILLIILSCVWIINAYWLDNLLEEKKQEAERYKQLYYQVCRELEEVCNGKMEL
jgi:hypothetical protein